MDSRIWRGGVVQVRCPAFRDVCYTLLRGGAGVCNVIWATPVACTPAPSYAEERKIATGKKVQEGKRGKIQCSHCPIITTVLGSPFSVLIYIQSENGTAASLGFWWLPSLVTFRQWGSEVRSSLAGRHSAWKLCPSYLLDMGFLVNVGEKRRREK